MTSARTTLERSDHIVRYPSSVEWSGLRADAFTINITLHPFRVEAYMILEFAKLGSRPPIGPADR